MDTQTVTVTVPEVALLDITGTAPSLSLDTIANAGDGFSAKTAEAGYKISANTNGTKKRHIDVAVTGAIPTGGALTITPTSASLSGATPTAKTLTSATTSATDLISNIGNVATTEATGLTYSFGPETAGGMINYTGTDGTTGIELTVTYTLSDDA